MRMILRGLLGLVGVGGLLLALQFWLNPAGPAAKLGLAPEGALGMATLRADMAGFFGVAGGFALAAAIRNRGEWLTAPLAMILVALVGRLITVAAQGLAPEMVQPIVVEAVLAVLLAVGRKSLG